MYILSLYTVELDRVICITPLKLCWGGEERYEMSDSWNKTWTYNI